MFHALTLVPSISIRSSKPGQVLLALPPSSQHAHVLFTGSRATGSVGVVYATARAPSRPARTLILFVDRHKFL